MLLSAVVLGAVLAAPPARADRASTALAKYEQPVSQSIDRALGYLAKRQRADGSIYASSRTTATAVTSLGVMAFLAKGYTPGTGPYGELIDRAVDFVLASQQANGVLAPHAGHGSMYSHAIATLMLSEVSGMVAPPRQARIDRALAKALGLILSAQKVPKSARHQGGWRYQHTSRDSDISCTGWAIMSLRSARNNGAPVPKEAVEAGVRFVLACRSPDGGFCYQPGGAPGLARTGTALLCLELCGHHGSKPAVEAGDWILTNTTGGGAAAKRIQQMEARLRARGKSLDAKVKAQLLARAAAARVRRFGGSHFYYGLYYCSQGMFQLGGRYWEQYATQLYEMMLKYQRADGSWPRSSSRAGECYATAMSVLAMSVSYRQLPIYQR